MNIYDRLNGSTVDIQTNFFFAYKSFVVIFSVLDSLQYLYSMKSSYIVVPYLRSVFMPCLKLHLNVQIQYL
jgi:hypothetical protein